MYKILFYEIKFYDNNQPNSKLYSNIMLFNDYILKNIL